MIYVCTSVNSKHLQSEGTVLLWQLPFHIYGCVYIYIYIRVSQHGSAGGALRAKMGPRVVPLEPTEVGGWYP